MSTGSKNFFRAPHIGLRNLKTAIAATLCAFVYAILDRNPTFACIGAVFAMNVDLRSSWETGGNRLWGTIIGGFTGMAFFYLFNQMPFMFPGDKLYTETIFLFVGIIVMILVSQLFNVNASIPSGSVVFYIVMLNTPENEYISYALARMLDTGIGVMMSILVNIALPRELFKRKPMSASRLDEKLTELESEFAAAEQLLEEEIEAEKRNSQKA